MTKTEFLESILGLLVNEHRKGVTIIQLASLYKCGPTLIKRVFRKHGIVPNPSKIQKGKPLIDPNSNKWNDICEKIRAANMGKGHLQTPETRQKISATRRLRGLRGGYKPGSGRGVKSWYESLIAGKVFMDSTYEVRYAKYLDANNIQWKKNKDRFPYQWNNQTRYYIPDFYLIEDDTYVEIKGFLRENDQAKWDAFPKNLKVIFGNELDKLTK